MQMDKEIIMKKFGEPKLLLNLLLQQIVDLPGCPLDPDNRSFFELNIPQQIKQVLLCSSIVQNNNKNTEIVISSAQDDFEQEAESIADKLIFQKNSHEGTASYSKHDLSSVRIHTDAQANKLAKLLNARAFAYGSHIVFGTGQYLPRTVAGKHLLAHELVHCLQQKELKTGIIQRAETDTRATIHSGVHLDDSADDVNKRINQALTKARKTAKGKAEKIIKGLYDELGVDGSVGRTKIELWARSLGSKKIHLPKQTITKYAGVRYRLWLQANLGMFPILNPTMLIKGIYVGSDKLGHFLQQGFQYYLIAKSKGQAAAEKFGLITEEGGFGLSTTGVLSHADLEANRQGLKFFQELEKNPNMDFDIANYINKKWNEGHNPSHYEENVAKHVWINLLNGRPWIGTIKDQDHSTQVTANITATQDLKLTGHFTYTRKIGGKATGKIVNGKITYLRSTDNAIRGVRIDFDWQLSPHTGSIRPGNGKGFWKSTGETRLNGHWGWGSKSKDRGEWRLAR